MKKSVAILMHSFIVLSLVSCSNREEEITVRNENSVVERKVNDTVKVNGGVQLFQKVAFHIDGDIGRYWKSSGNNFFYTKTVGEAPGDYTYQMTIGRANSIYGGNAGLGRWYNPSTEDRLITISNEVNNNPSWVFEGQIGVVSTIPVNEGSLFGTHPVYRYRKYNGGRHLFTVDFNELGGGNSYWIYEGVAFHMYYN